MVINFYASRVPTSPIRLRANWGLGGRRGAKSNPEGLRSTPGVTFGHPRGPFLRPWGGSGDHVKCKIQAKVMEGIAKINIRYFVLSNKS